MSENKYYELKEQAIESLEFRGHKVMQWEEYKASYRGAIYGYDSSITKATSSCIYCQKEVRIEVNPRPNGIHVSGEAVALNCIDGVKNPDGIALTTYSHCHLCGKKSTANDVLKKGVHTKCQNNKLKIPNSAKFKNLKKHPRQKHNRLPVLDHVLLIVGHGKMFTISTDLEKAVTVNVDNVDGDCRICVPRNTFVELMQLIDNDYVIFSQDNETMTLVITGENYTNRIKGINFQEFPPSIEGLPRKSFES